MTAKAQMRLLNNQLCRMSIKQALMLLDTKTRVINERRYKATDIALNHLLMLSDIDKCNKILKDL